MRIERIMHHTSIFMAALEKGILYTMEKEGVPKLMAINVKIL